MGILSEPVAKAVGWFVDCIRDDSSSVTMLVYNPQKELVFNKGYILPENDSLPDIDQCWAWAYKMCYPDYDGDIGQALTLTVEGWELQLWERNEKQGKWFAHYFNDRNANVATGWSDSPAEAICKARLALEEHLQWVASLPVGI